MIGMILAFILLFLTASLVEFKLYSDQMLYLAAAFIACAVSVVYLKKKNPKVLRILTISLSVLWGSAGMFYLLLFGTTFLSSAYSGAENKNNYFSGHNVMIIIPHEDDEVNLAGGVIEEYLNAGSTVRIVYATNGDRWAEGRIRINESIEAMRRTGVPEEDLIFLGYGDMWRGQTYEDGSYSGHIYNAKDGALWTSLKNQDTDFKAHTETYGTETHPPYRTHEYTRENYVTDIRDVILEYKPDVIYANDFDDHADHRGLSLFFEEAMGMILKSDPGYRPRVFKGFCYETAWDAPDDYDSSDNVLSTRRPENSFSLYDWNDRLRIPVMCSSLGHSIRRAGLFNTLSAFVSQNGEEAAYKVINGDRAFWERRTDSVLYNAELSSGSSEISILTDFKLMDSDDVIERDRISAGTFKTKPGTKINVLLRESVDIYEIALAGDPSPNNTIIEGHIDWDDGTETPFGTLKPEGGETFIICEKEKVNSFTLVIDSVEGEGAGLTEIEAFKDHRVLNYPEFIKIADNDGEFLYDATVPDGETEMDLLLYGGSGNPEFSISGDPECVLNEGRTTGTVIVTVPRGKSCKVEAREGELSDTVVISNPGFLKRRMNKLVRDTDSFLNRGKGFLAGRYRHYRSIYRAIMIKLQGEG